MQQPFSFVDHLILNLDRAVTTLWGQPAGTGRANPADSVNSEPLSKAEQKHNAGLMRVNHAGEVAAQALYQGQALTARLPEVRAAMEHAALEENDHLIWCDQRLQSLHSHRSILNPLWYIGSFTIGAIAGKAGDNWSLGFVGETERQVTRHLDQHLNTLAGPDNATRAVLEQMKIDEIEHGEQAMAAGGSVLPAPVRQLMRLTSKIMTRSSYWV
ncbi:2-octaprenyl-3-methyl-6-methoxy-1,4-benzoquinol hydroxylase [Methylophaga frappieri]|uniref:3-demethoxyubiquinol 3-hydroxylase n=1 Tax=Methylophaga frappieri (strain ATCC BAA-2434 / DSM 25690 / JAM7) TaxID=754477 RepID=I1YGZ0_METFJ|nr:2-polyprenyl-3-methyl-6-methoxy-1,4-benzoquinone monooxygenase [Methylophaga frappieri]AFJ02183.1 2-octaprenyl-3-methyl-6-methoxy-1,4-benzoquinol hydroxylase [Methylophaga frappieri]